MSRSTIRAAVASYLEGAGITSLTTVFAYPPKLTPEGDFYQGSAPDHKSGAVVYLWITGQKEQRIAVGGFTNGRKMVSYEFVLDCYFRSTTPKSEDAATENDAFIDSLISEIRANRIAGAPGVVFQWGEGGHNGGTDIDVVSYYPKMLGGAASVSQVYSELRITVLEEIDS
jgi:hypothetical protein